MSSKKPVTIQNMNPNIKRLEYAVRGPIVTRALELQSELNKGASKPFKEVIRCNIGDCHATGQKPITFLRQVIAVCTYPPLFDDPSFPSDVKEKAKKILSGCGGNSIGAYSISTGIQVIREDVAAYIKERDGLDSDPENIFLSSGASEAIKMVLSVINSCQPGKGKTGVMVPVPMYPLYSATLAEYDEYQINYYLDEDKVWGLTRAELDRAYNEHKDKCEPRAICVISPGNPTGQVLTLDDMQIVINFAYERNLMILADEVYQHNVYVPDRKFISFKRALHDMGGDIAKSVVLASFMSSSKGFMGECGYRGGYCELVNFDLDVRAQLYKCLSAKLCSPVSGQAMMDVVVSPPKPGDPSYNLFIKEKQEVLDSLKKKAQLVTQTFKSMPGMSCNEVQGAMYAFPRLHLPPKAIEAAKKKNMAADAMYCFELLEETGVCIVPGSGFGQQEGTHHFRTTILPSVEKIQDFMEKISKFHKDFMAKYQ